MAADLMRLVATWLRCRRIPGAKEDGYHTMLWRVHLVRQLKRGKSKKQDKPLATVLKDFFDVSHLGDESNQFGWPNVRIPDPATGRRFPDPCLSDGRKVWLAYEWNRAWSIVDKLKDTTSEDNLVQELFAKDAPVACKEGHQAWLMLHPKHEGQVTFVKLPGDPPKWCDGRPYVGCQLAPSAEHRHEGRRTMVECKDDIEVRGSLLICQVSLHRASSDHTSLQIPEVDFQKKDVIQHMLSEQAGLALQHWCLLFDVMCPCYGAHQFCRICRIHDASGFPSKAEGKPRELC